jgi:enolase
MLFINNTNIPNREEFILSFTKLWASITKVLTSGKRGAEGMRPNSSNSFNSPNDTINDTIKILEDIIKDTGDSTKYSIGIDCGANSFYTDTTKKYEMDGFKQPPDADQLLDFYLKFVTDHPQITYIEDMLADSDLDGWKKVKVKKL